MSSADPASTVDQAIAWAVKLDFGTPSAYTRQAFETWLQAAPDHAQAWERVRSIQSDFSRLPPRIALDALQAADAQRRLRGLNRRQALRVLALAGVAVSTGWGLRSYTPWQRLVADASTGVGEQRTLRLDDGTLLVLNTDTAVSTDLRGSDRVITLHRGEILVTTGPDGVMATKRPFWVHTPVGRLQALGTRFVVRLQGDRARVSVQEGAVDMQPTGATPHAIARPGESWWLDHRGATPAPLPAYAVDGWADGVLTGQNIPLADLLAELARYRSGHIACDARVAGLRVSGTYHVRDTDQVLQFLLQTQPISVVYRTRFWVTVGPEGAG